MEFVSYRTPEPLLTSDGYPNLPVSYDLHKLTNPGVVYETMKDSSTLARENIRDYSLDRKLHEYKNKKFVRVIEEEGVAIVLHFTNSPKKKGRIPRGSGFLAEGEGCYSCGKDSESIRIKNFNLCLGCITMISRWTTDSAGEYGIPMMPNITEIQHHPVVTRIPVEERLAKDIIFDPNDRDRAHQLLYSQSQLIESALEMVRYEHLEWFKTDKTLSEITNKYPPHTFQKGKGFVYITPWKTTETGVTMERLYQNKIFKDTRHLRIPNVIKNPTRGRYDYYNITCGGYRYILCINPEMETLEFEDVMSKPSLKYTSYRPAEIGPNEHSFMDDARDLVLTLLSPEKTKLQAIRKAKDQSLITDFKQQYNAMDITIEAMLYTSAFGDGLYSLYAQELIEVDDTQSEEFYNILKTEEDSLRESISSFLLNVQNPRLPRAEDRENTIKMKKRMYTIRYFNNADFENFSMTRRQAFAYALRENAGSADYLEYASNAMESIGYQYAQLFVPATVRVIMRPRPEDIEQYHTRILDGMADGLTEDHLGNLILIPGSDKETIRSILKGHGFIPHDLISEVLKDTAHRTQKIIRHRILSNLNDEHRNIVETLSHSLSEMPRILSQYLSKMGIISIPSTRAEISNHINILSGILESNKNATQIINVALWDTPSDEEKNDRLAEYLSMLPSEALDLDLIIMKTATIIQQEFDQIETDTPTDRLNMTYFKREYRQRWNEMYPAIYSSRPVIDFLKKTAVKSADEKTRDILRLKKGMEKPPEYIDSPPYAAVSEEEKLENSIKAYRIREIDKILEKHAKYQLVSPTKPAEVYPSEFKMEELYISEDTIKTWVGRLNNPKALQNVKYLYNKIKDAFDMWKDEFSMLNYGRIQSLGLLIYRQVLMKEVIDNTFWEDTPSGKPSPEDDKIEVWKNDLKIKRVDWMKRYLANAPQEGGRYKPLSYRAPWKQHPAYLIRISKDEALGDDLKTIHRAIQKKIMYVEKIRHVPPLTPDRFKQLGADEEPSTLLEEIPGLPGDTLLE